MRNKYKNYTLKIRKPRLTNHRAVNLGATFPLTVSGGSANRFKLISCREISNLGDIVSSRKTC